MDTFGARLKFEREDRGLTIRAVAETPSLFIKGWAQWCPALMATPSRSNS